MKLETLLPLVGVFVGWSLKTVSDYLTQRKEETRHYRVATFYILRIYKSITDYERATRFFRQENPTVEKFEPWRAILESRCRESFEVNAHTTSKAVETLASINPPLAARLDNTIRNILFTFNNKNMPSLAINDQDRYAKLLCNQDQLVEMTLKDFKTVALKLASCGGFRQKAIISHWFAERERGTNDFMDRMHEQEDLLRKVVEP
jgi:hypothetical protein